MNFQKKKVKYFYTSGGINVQLSQSVTTPERLTLEEPQKDKILFKDYFNYLSILNWQSFSISKSDKLKVWLQN